MHVYCLEANQNSRCFLTSCRLMYQIQPLSKPQTWVTYGGQASTILGGFTLKHSMWRWTARSIKFAIKSMKMLLSSMQSFLPADSDTDKRDEDVFYITRITKRQSIHRFPNHHPITIEYFSPKTIRIWAESRDLLPLERGVISPSCRARG